MFGPRVSKDLPEYGLISGIWEAGIEDVLSEIEKGREERISEFLGSLARSIRLLGEKAAALVSGQGIQLSVAERGFKLGKEKVLIPDGIFLQLAL